MATETLRSATDKDIVGITYVQATSWIKNYQSQADGITEADIRSLDFRGKLAEWQHVLRSPSYRVWVIVDGENVLAFLAARLDADQAEIYEQHTLPNYQRRGFGKRLFGAAVEWIGGYSISLRMPIFTQSGLEFYQAHGFSVNVNGAVDFIRLPSGKQIPTIIFVRAPTQDQPTGTKSRSNPAPVKKIRAASNLVGAQPKSQPTPKRSAIGRNRLASLSGVRASTIKYYTEIGILPFVQEDARLARRYDAKVATERLKEIGELRARGLSIKDIRGRFRA